MALGKELVAGSTEFAVPSQINASAHPTGCLLAIAYCPLPIAYYPYIYNPIPYAQVYSPHPALVTALCPEGPGKGIDCNPLFRIPSVTLKRGFR